MKALFTMILSALPLCAAAQGADELYRRACGPRDAKFDVEHVKEQLPATVLPGKALVYFIEDDYGWRFTNRVGLDGAWAGALKTDSYMIVQVTPGEHHVCALRQEINARPRLANFTAEAGKVYYYLIRAVDTNSGGNKGVAFELSVVDRDEALFLIASNPQSVAKPKP